MLAEIITIGDEILIGQIVDTNSAFISKELNKIGVQVYQITSVQDDKEHILEMLGIELGPVRLKCALLSLKVLKAGIYGVGESESKD